MKLKLIKEEDGYSIYENPDKELKKLIQEFPTPTEVTAWQLDNGKPHTFVRRLANGNYLFESKTGDLSTLDAEDYDDVITSTKLKSINQKYKVSEVFNKYFFPYQSDGYRLYNVTQEFLGNETFYCGVNAIYQYTRWNAYTNRRTYQNGTRTIDFHFEISQGTRTGHTYFNEEGDIKNRDYNQDFNSPLPPKSLEEVKAEYLSYFDDITTELFYSNGNWFTDDYVIFQADTPNNKLVFLKWPRQGGVNYFPQGDSYRKIRRGKKGEEVPASHLKDFIKRELSNFVDPIKTV